MGGPESKPHAVPWPRDYAEPAREYVPPLRDDEIKDLRHIVETVRFRARIWRRVVALIAFVATLVPSIFAAWEFLRDRISQ